MYYLLEVAQLHRRTGETVVMERREPLAVRLRPHPGRHHCSPPALELMKVRAHELVIQQLDEVHVSLSTTLEVLHDLRNGCVAAAGVRPLSWGQ